MYNTLVLVSLAFVGYSNAAAAQVTLGLASAPLAFTAAPFPTAVGAPTDF